MEQIKKIVKDNDIAAFVLLHDEAGFSEYLNAVSPSYSCAILQPDQIRFRLKTAEVGKERAQQIANGTFSMVTHFSSMIAKHAMLYMDAEKMLKEAWGGEQFPGSETGHDQQNN